ncbi:MAG: prolyl oligopeptidase family serine peptidase [Bacteroidales bacterium]|nr:prolyl oligopeptidase family serine peptidase [Bacteroidales bacterium]
MKRTMFLFALALLCLGANAQKKPLDHSVYDGWQSGASPVLSEDGTIAAYRVTPQEGDAVLHFFNAATGLGRTVERGGPATLTRDGRWAFFKISAPFAETRKARIAKKKPDEMPKDTLGYMDLRTFEIRKIGNVSSFRTSWAGDLAVFESGTGDKKVVVVLDPATGRCDTLRNVDKYTLSHDGSKLAVVYKKNKKDSLSRDAVVLRNLLTRDSTLLSAGRKFYSAPKFNAAGDKLVFLASADSNATGSKSCAVLLWEGGRRAEEIVSQGYTTGLPKGFGINENAAPYFSKNSSRLFLGIGQMLPENDTTLVDFETARLDIWNYDIYLTPPMQKAQSARLKVATAKAVINLAADKGLVIPLSASVFERVTPLDGGESPWALAVTNEPYQINSTWDSNSYCDVALVSLADGRRRQLYTRLNGSPSPSPEGKYLTWYDDSDSNFYSYRISDGKVTNLTAGVDGTFFDDEDDHPMPKPQLDRPHWLEGDSAFLLADKFDIFRFSPDGGKPVNVTKGAGRRDGIQYRCTTLEANRTNPALVEAGVQRTIGAKETVYLTAFERATKRNGYASVPASGSGIKSSFLEEKSFTSATKAGKSILYQKGDFRNPADFYLTKNEWKNSVRLTQMNPQQADYRWGDVQLVHWNAYDGTPLDGLLFVPEDYDPNGKYPMMIYFYEKNAETLYNYRAPAPSRSTVNIPYFVSNGYVVFIPDIVYKDGHPGESAYNCICSGAEAMCAQFPFVDRTKMAIQGQSWGGYQTAYLVTRTNMFAAAGAGAPVGNMTSAYGGIRWESGMVRAMQYEHGQSRIGASLWDEGGLDLYIENSPVFHTQNVTTPVLIMHNDADGAVPWYQGIEFFMALRRFHHPAWLLEYNDEAHNLVERRNTKDLSVRLQQFFDHYLKGAPMPAWMKTGVPNTRKGQYFGFEYAE